jgi:hypothetical protein
MQTLNMKTKDGGRTVNGDTPLGKVSVTFYASASGKVFKLGDDRGIVHGTARGLTCSSSGWYSLQIFSAANL